MMKQKPIKLRMDAATYYIWVGGSCDYAHEERAGGGAYIMEKNGKVVERYSIADLPTTEFRMMLTVMLHAMDYMSELSFPQFSDEVFQDILVTHQLQARFRVYQLLIHLSGIKQVECPFDTDVQSFCK